MVRYLLNNEKAITRPIWERIFEEDSKDFLDYYYNYKNEDNKILCKFVDDNISSMLHLNPYKIYINNKEYLSYYIVAVATLPEYRKKGYMAELLHKSLNDMYKENVPFTFLRPAKKEIYLPFDFEYIYNHNFLEINNSNFEEIELTEKDYTQIADFTNNFLEKRYKTFCKRDFNYIKVLHQEVKSENGNIIMLFNNNKLIGYYVYWGVNEKIIRAIFLDNAYTNIKNIKPLVMARIINLYEFFKNFSLKDKNDNICMYFNIVDNIIKENNGIFKLTVYDNKSKIEKTSHRNENILNINIQDLLSVFFGYKDISLFTKNDYILKNFHKINLLDKVFIDEEV
ncbi:GNAT family N-acetyltransferase [uncultured Tyzzerella sp.]|uniref:GNAT family N-acetyltransferase n=1 Tax=uncultured Tyzzerella sp. TaxID=2321398 RepID=UPI002942AC52|nr:GNAT family N-acetyltransferase [uncultured Tyzzerella sp.]